MMDFSVFQHAYAISGGIGSGKSSVCEILSSLGYTVLDADKIAHEILDNQSKKIGEVFGSELIGKGRVNRRALAKIVFSSKNELEKLQNLLNPYIYENLFSQCQNLEESKRPYFVEIPLLFEQREVLNFRHKVLVVGRDITQRVMQRDGVSEEEVRARIKAQMSVEERKMYASEVIENFGSKNELRDKILKWVKGLGN
ncbi:dephospho-CoA kinase [Helicobacter cholecystus]|uniref:dephospho-CoA kinase n=1 Tax=Helicobacter cholecystus TaxID=45498 RepID=UPI002738284A|nr:dephospho-CoA kinase [Helicobacter cholecystus]